MPEPVAEDLDFSWDGLTLAGTLHIPPNVAPANDGPQADDGPTESGVPVVLMMQGSGPADRDSGGYFPLIRDTFLAKGIATYSFDKPGCGHSTGNWLHYALNGRADQAEAAIEMLRQHPMVDETSIGLFGHSQGGWLTQMIAGRRDDLAFAVMSSGPSITVDLQNLYGCEHSMRSDGHPEADIDKALAFIGQVQTAAKDGVPYETVRDQLIKPVEDEAWYVYLRIDDKTEWGMAELLVSENYEPLDALAKVSCPILVVFGGEDVLVPPWQGAEETGRALRKAPTGDVTVVVFPDGNHRIKESDEFVPGYLDLLGDWTVKRAYR